MNDTTTAASTHQVDGGSPTDAEARLAAQVDTIGENPLVDPDVTAASGATDTAATDGDAGAAAASGTAEGDQAGSSADDTAAAAAAAAATAAQAAPAAAPAAAAPAAAQAPAQPTPPKDFDAEFTALQKRYDDGEIDGSEFQQATRTLGKEETAFQTRLTMWQEDQARTANAAAQDFTSAATAWEQANKEFMDNPLRRDAMQRAIAVIDEQTGGALAPAELLQRAGAAAFEAFGFKPAAANSTTSSGAAAAAAIAQATAARTPAPVPATLASAPAAASMERAAGNTAFGALDGSDINSLENAIARMSPDQLDAYLRDAPGASTTGKPE